MPQSSESFSDGLQAVAGGERGFDVRPGPAELACLGDWFFGPKVADR